jgi:formylglycine-generating enzyme required for sulfatase activity
LGNGKPLLMWRIPAGEFAMGDINGYPDEYPVTKVSIRKPFWMGATEISLEQYRSFDPKHANGYYDMHYKDQVKPGYLMDSPTFPAIRVSWNEAMEFCRWLSRRTGRKVTLPTEAQWEWAARAGSDTPLWYGDLNTDFSKLANLADLSIKQLAVSGVDPKPIPNPGKNVDFVPKDERFDDGVLHLAACGSYAANPWGLKDMHGNVAEWTRNTYQPYPYSAASEKDDGAAAGMAKRTVRGGSWRDRPKNARSGFRQAYPAWQSVYNVGFRVIVED